MTTPYRKILCPIDFSNISRAALRWSLDFAKGLGSELTVLHVIDTELLNVGNLVAVPDAVAALREQARAQLAEWSSELDFSKAQVKVEEGPPADSIVAATESGADLLVMGTHGHTGLQKLLLGSVMEKVLHRVDVPLLAFSPESPDAEPTVKNILLAVDFGPETASVARHGVWLGEHFGAKLFGFHAVPVPYMVLNDRTLERLGPEDLERLKDTLTAERRKELAAVFPESSAPVEVLATVGSPYRSMLDAIQKHSIDLVVMGRGGHGSHNLGWVGSTCHKLVRAARCPVLIVPE